MKFRLHDISIVLLSIFLLGGTLAPVVHEIAHSFQVSDGDFCSTTAKAHTPEMAVVQTDILNIHGCSLCSALVFAHHVPDQKEVTVSLPEFRSSAFLPQAKVASFGVQQSRAPPAHHI